MCVEPFAVDTDTWLLCHIQFEPHHQIWRWHNSDVPYQQWWRLSLEEVHLLINWCDISIQQNQRNNCGPQEETHATYLTYHQSVPGGAYHRWPNMVHQHHLPSQEGTVMPPFPSPDEESWPPSFCPNYLLQGCYWEHPYQQPLSLVWQLPCCWPEGPTKGGEDSREDHQISPTIHPGPVPVPLPQESHRHHQRPHQPSTQTVHSPTIWQALPQHAVQDYQTQQKLFPTGHQTTQLTQENSINMTTLAPTNTNWMLK